MSTAIDSSVLWSIFKGEKDAESWMELLVAARRDSNLVVCEIVFAYRREGGPRTHLIPDFLVGAHACNQAACLAARDRGYLRRYSPELPILAPPGDR